MILLIQDINSASLLLVWRLVLGVCQNAGHFSQGLESGVGFRVLKWEGAEEELCGSLLPEKWRQETIRATQKAAKRPQGPQQTV